MFIYLLLTSLSLYLADLSTLNPPVMEGLDALLAVMHYCVLTVISLSILYFISMYHSNFTVTDFRNLSIWWSVLTQKWMVSNALFNRESMLGWNLWYKPFFIHVGFPQEQSPLTNKWFSSKSSKKVMLMLYSQPSYDLCMLLGLALVNNYIQFVYWASTNESFEENSSMTVVGRAHVDILVGVLSS